MTDADLQTYVELYGEAQEAELKAAQCQRLEPTSDYNEIFNHFLRCGNKRKLCHVETKREMLRRVRHFRLALFSDPSPPPTLSDFYAFVCAGGSVQEARSR